MLDSTPDTSPIAALRAYLDRWAAAHSSCEPANRRVAEEGVCLAYATAGLLLPERIVWCGGPLEIAEHLAAAQATDAIGTNVKPEFFDHVRNRVGTFAEVFWKEVMVAATQLTDDDRVGSAVEGYEKCKSVSAAINRVVETAAIDSLARVGVRARHALLRMRGGPRLLPRWKFDEGDRAARSRLAQRL